MLQRCDTCSVPHTLCPVMEGIPGEIELAFNFHLLLSYMEAGDGRTLNLAPT